MFTLLQRGSCVLTVAIVVIYFGQGISADPKQCSPSIAAQSCQTLGTSVGEMGRSLIRDGIARLTEGSDMSTSEMALMCEEAETTKACVELFITKCVTDSMRRFEPLTRSIENFRQSSARLEEACNHANVESLAAVTQNILSVDSAGCDANIAMQPCDSFGEMLQEKAKSLLRSSLNVLLGGQLTIDVCRDGQSTQACSELFLLRCVPESLRASEPVIQQIQSNRRNAAKVHSSCKRIFGALIPDMPSYNDQETKLLSAV